MATLFVDRVQESSTSTGTGDIALGGISQPGLATFSSAFSDGALVSYVITNQAVNTEFERGIGTFHSGPDSISRTYVLAGAAYPSPTNFSAGTKNVVNPAPTNTAGNAYASSYVYVPGDTAVLGGTTWYSLNVNSNSAPSTGNPNWVSLGGGGGGGGAVSSVFGRTGAVVASAGDYSAYYGGLESANDWTANQQISSGTLTLGSNTLATAPSLFLDSAAGQYRVIQFQTAGSFRWLFYTDNSAESGSNAGSNLHLDAYNDVGVGLFPVLQVTRATGALYSKNNTLDDGNGNATFVGTISASNFSGSSSGTNTGDQNLAPYALLSGATFTGTVTAPSYVVSADGLFLYQVSSGVLGVRSGTSGGGYRYFSFDASGNFNANNGGITCAGYCFVANGQQMGQATGTLGSIRLNPGNTTQSGYLEIWPPSGVSGTRVGYIGWDTADLAINSATISMQGVVSCISSVTATSFNTSSSLRYKENVYNLPDSTLLDQLSPKSFNLKSDGSRHFGFIVEDTHQFLPELTGFNKEGLPDSFRYEEVIPLLVARVKVLTKELALLKEQLHG